MGVETNTYDIPELVLGDTFYEWFTLTNNEIINKLNRLEIYTPFSAGGSAGDGISAGTDSTGALHIEVISPIQKDMVFNGNLTVNGTTTTINSTDFTVDDFNIVLGATAGNTANDQEIMDFSGNSAGGGFIIRGSSGDKEFLWKYSNAAFNINQNLDFADQKSISSSGDGVRIATGASGGNATKGLIFGFTAGTTGGVTGSNTLVRTFNTDISEGQSADAFYVNDDGYVSIVNGANKMTITQTSHGLSFGMPVYMKTSDGKYTKAVANSAATSEVIGVVSRVYNDDKFELSLSGEIIGDFSQINEGNAALIAGQAYFVDTANAGRVTPTKPTNEDFFQKAVLIGLTSDRAIVKNFIGAEIAQEQRAADALVSNKIQIEQAGHGFTNGHALYHDGTQYRAAEAEDGLDAVVGIVEKVNSANIFEMVLSGQIRFPEVPGHGCNAMRPGETHYIKPSGTNATFANVINEFDLEPGGFQNNDIDKPLFVATSNSTAIVTNLRGILFDDTEENNTIDVPVGAIMAFSGTVIPDGYALCDGETQFPVSDCPELFAAIGTRYNRDTDTDGSLFRVPDLSDRFIMGADDPQKNGESGGLAEVTLTHEQSGLPEHTHRVSIDYDRDGSTNDTPSGSNIGTVLETTQGVNGGPQDAAEAHENRPPYLTLVWIIRTKGVNTLLDGTQILGGDFEYQPVGDDVNLSQTGNGVLLLDEEAAANTNSQPERLYTLIQRSGGFDNDTVVVSKAELAESGTGIFPELIRKVTIKLRTTLSGGNGRTGFYYKYPDGVFRKAHTFRNQPNAGTFEANVELPVNSDQIELEFVFFADGSQGTPTLEAYIVGVQQVVDNSRTRLKKSYGSRKNLLLNGNFDFWERQVATGVTFDATTSDLYSADRWKRTSSGDSDMTREVQRGDFSVSANPPEKLESGNFPKHYINLKGHSSSLQTAQFAALEQRIEDYRTLNHKNAALSFWAKGNVIGNFHVGLIRRSGQDGSLGEQFVNIKDFRISETGTWKKYTASIVVPEVTFGYDKLEDTYLSLIFHTAVKGGERGYVGTSDINYQGTLSIAQVQLEEGSRVTPFEHLSPAEELPLLNRYFTKAENGFTHVHVGGAAEVGGDVGGSVIFSSPMRTTPTFVKYTALLSDGSTEGGGADTVASITPRGFLCANLQQGNSNARIYGTYEFDAEL